MKKFYRMIFLLAISLGLSPLYAGGFKPYPESAPTPPLVLKDLAGVTHNLADYRGQIVLLQFWATYCTPCRKEMPSMNRLMKKMGDTPFTILAVDMGEPAAEVKKFVNEVKPEFTILLDEPGQSIAEWRVFAAPSNFIISPDGKIRYTLFGGVEWDSEEMVKALKSLANNS